MDSIYKYIVIIHKVKINNKCKSLVKTGVDTYTMYRHTHNVLVTIIPKLFSTIF